MPKIRVHDFETTGLEADSKVCEMGWCDVVNDGGGWKIGRQGSSLYEVDEMPPQARAIHHISAAETKGFQVFEPSILWVQAKADGVDVVASHNTKYDGAYWGEPELPVLCTLKAARQVWPLEAPAHGNGVLRYWLEDQGLIAPDNALTAHILLVLLTKATAAQMVAWTKLPLLQPRITFGKHKGEWADAPADYLQWIMRSDLDDDTKWNADRELTRRQVAA